MQIQSFWKYYSSAHKHMQQITKVTLIQSAAIQNRFFLFAKHPLTLKYFWAADGFKLTYGVYIKITGSYIQITVIYDSYVIDCNCNLLPPLLSRRQPQCLNYSQVDLGVFALQGRRVALMKLKFGMDDTPNFTFIDAGIGTWTTVIGPLENCNFIKLWNILNLYEHIP